MGRCCVGRGNCVCCCYCIRKGLIRKAHFAYNMKKWIAKRPKGKLVHAIPETYFLDVPDPEYIEEALCDVPEVRDMQEGKDVWIAKPSLMNQALAIVVFDRLSVLNDALTCEAEIREWVVQRYVHPPLLIQKRKFHIRTYVLCVGNLNVYVWKDMLVLLAGVVYDTGLAELNKKEAHLTNTCLMEGRGRDLDLVHLLSELPDMLVADGWDLSDTEKHVEFVSGEIRALIGECFDAMSCELSFRPIPNCFEFFGFDFLVDASWNCWLLEANAEPDFKQTGERLKKRLQLMFEDAFQLIIDPLHPLNPDPWSFGDHPTGNQWTPVFRRGAGI